MSDTTGSPQENRRRNIMASRYKSRQSGIGCLVVFVILLVGLVGAAVLWGPSMLTQLAHQMGGSPVVLNDRTSPEQLAAHREREMAQLNSYGWVDQEAGIARIPIDHAIDLIAAGDLPVGALSTESETPATDTANTAPVDLTNVNYQDHVLPIFEQHCTECHGAEDPEEGLELTRYRTAMVGSQNGSVIEPGEPDNSYLVEQIVTGEMPKRGDPLSPEEIEIITAWIEAGAPETGATAPEPTAAPVDLTNVNYRDHVLPIFEQHCAECHGAEDPEEGLELTRYRTAIVGSQNGPVIEPGAPDNSYLVELIITGEMPKRGDPLSSEEIEIITAWIEAGAPEN